MGKGASKLHAKLALKKDLKLLLIGLDASGKTTILYKLKLADSVQTVPTMEWNMETVKYKNIRLDLWDSSGQKQLRQMWKHYYEKIHGLIFVIDSADTERLKEVREELHLALNEKALGDVPVLVFANKQDMPRAVKVETLKQELKLDSFPQNIHIQPAIATEGEGLMEGVDWLISAIKDS